MVVMRRSINSWLIIVVVFILKTQTSLTQQINRASFPKGFVFGTASSAFQYEGAVKEDGRGPSIWDSFSHSFGKVIDRTDADVAVDQYHRFAEDIQLMKDMSMDAYRFSISWSRIYPNGSGAINQAGIDHYSKLINALLAAGIEPYVTLYHWDLPQALDDTYKGWLSRQIIKDFAAFAETCFKEFGDRVKHWITFNEPHTFTIQGYDVGLQAPGRCSILQRLLCRAGNSTTEPYIVAHNVILTHATVVHIYRKKYKAKQRGSIGISLDVIWFTPASNSTKDIKATQRAQDFQLGWFIEPLILGDYPRSMKSRVKDRLPTFSKIEAYSIWLYIVPGGMRSLMNYIKNKYGNIPIMITENGMDDPNNRLTPIKDALKDEKRIKYHNDYLTNLLASIKEDGCNVKGYFVWSLLDNWEWAAGYTSRFGLYFVDFEHNLKRYPKDSVKWFKNFLTSS
ncbi:beta-glucosidase 40-like isoform X2 [Mercurialis annua]|uniref:beta-glucosidase 40-like isoform X2 n=1 Tax=Mercurialis annua TaxID=3986 RepID=UPI0021600E77|nr:beta-glucosidase 40-like isoform X2 [Mercurialis annua]